MIPHESYDVEVVLASASPHSASFDQPVSEAGKLSSVSHHLSRLKNK